ncbi:hypothetical protein ABMA28_009363 [Loxostege sticticalis]|uniref:BED-type domain-containing protein n=1 Tax=Loxostege sticticalis TaxID=481309 RepID=A0ABD0SD34_LOXSC
MGDSSSGAKKSGVWTYFVEADQNCAKCNLCEAKLSRGGEGRKRGTSTLKKHLQFKHKAEFDKIFGPALAATTSNESTSIASTSADCNSQTSQYSVSHRPLLKQPSLAETLEKKKVWDINDSRAKRVHYLIGEMIAVDNEPFAIVESHEGFRRLLNNILPQYQIPGRNYFSENIISDIYQRVVSKIRANIAPAEYISFTTDLWTCQVNKLCFMSCTAHWLSEDYELNHAVLNMKVFPESHTAENIKNCLRDCISDWDISVTKVRAVVHDNAANVSKGVSDANFPSIRCFIHTLQLVINDAIAANPSVVATVSAARRIVTHFNHSGYKKLHEIQEELNLPKNKLHQDVLTRWNSTYYLLERISEQRRAISVYFTEAHNLNFNNLTSSQWEIVQQLIILLKPFEEITKITSSTLSPISDVIPHVATLLRYLQKPELAGKTCSIDDFRCSLIDNMKMVTRFNHEKLHGEAAYFLSTFLDPRYKSVFYNAFQVEQARQAVLREALIISLEYDNDDEHDDAGPSKNKRSRPETNDVASEAHDLFWSCFEETADNNDALTSRAQPKNSAASELDHYLSTARAARNTDPYKWWGCNRGHYPILSKVSAKYISTPASSIYSERLFSEAGLIYEKKRSRLNADRAEKMAFLHHNLPILNYKY